MSGSVRRLRIESVLGRKVSPTARDDNGWTDLHYAAALNLPELAAYLVDSGAKVDARLKDDNKYLTVKLKKILKESGKNFDYERRLRQTPLHIAALQNARETTALLIDNGANVHAKMIMEVHRCIMPHPGTPERQQALLIDNWVMFHEGSCEDTVVAYAVSEERNRESANSYTVA